MTTTAGPRHKATGRTGDTRDDILRVAGRLLRTRGYSAFSFGHIAEELGVKPAAIHYHFPSKTDLGRALIARFTERYRRWMDEADEQGLPPEEKLAGYLRIVDKFGEGGTSICAIGALQADWGALPDELRPEVAQMLREVLAWLGRVLREGQEQGVFTFAGDADAVAYVVATSLAGALHMRRALGDAAFAIIVGQIRCTLGWPEVIR